MADIIQLLPDHVANQIAAGEVVQRPASVVKELLENAIDAKADTITLVVKDAGKTLVQVIDNGIGMSNTDARLSFERHATSKIRVAEDLFHLNTKGFRGEALASIAAIAHVELITRREMDELGTQIKIEGSKVISQEVITAPFGTSIAVKNLFYNIPARRNFLKSDAVELRHVIDEFHRVALAHPDIAFTLYHNNGELFNLPASNLRQRVVNVFGGKTNEKLVPVNEETEIAGITGFVGKPSFARKSRGEQFFFVNDRFVKSSYLHHAITAAFEGLLPQKCHPTYFLYFNIDPEKIDINIHPTKTEIKFEDEHSLYAILRSAVKHSLGQFNVAPVLDFQHDSNMDTPYSYKNREAAVPKIQVDPTFNPFKEDGPVKKTFSGAGYKKESGSWENLYVGLESKVGKQELGVSTISFESEEVTGHLFTDKEKEEQQAITTYQLHSKYIVSTIKSGMVVIDQYRAHQRVLYEQLLANMTIKDTVSQQLLFPLQLNYTSAEVSLLKPLKDDLERAGFVFTAVEENNVEITGIPINVTESEVTAILDELLSDLQQEVPDTGFSQIDMLAKSMAKSIAVKGGMQLETMAQERLVNDLFACKEPSVSPFNKPTFITISVAELDKKFS
ncbi:DNA mismatch repair endonuclease MutL [Sungkyunkwania multivorans]|uniref:DNA mismatch repair protein MutL n=1 Tax=Sungkyunkwania multivorans TaxID=1173618 RepID=A0ABW3CVZ2_9FLAO